MDNRTHPRIVLEKAEPDEEPVPSNKRTRDSPIIKDMNDIPTSMKPASSQYREHLEKKRIETELLKEQQKREEDIKIIIYTVGGLLLGGALIYIGKQYLHPIVSETGSNTIIETGNEIIKNTTNSLLLNKNKN
jgi:ATP-dependent protease ClpP protease subunit